ncbi:MAG: alpha-glucan family phosphorylase [Actinomycetota bacterium]|nr:alpha-glucan family phosphorylase [Actinomycetota bacterium]
MKALRSFAVRASLPEPLDALPVIATNLRWSWDGRALDLFRWVDPDVWDEAGHDPVRMLGLVSKERFAELAEDGPFLTFLASVSDGLARYLNEPRWYQGRHTETSINTVAYFSPEFGVCEALPTYSGGLGVLAGDHLKAASDLGIPLVGIGLLYRQGYFRQQLNADGWQQERYPALDPHGMPLTLVPSGDDGPVKVEVDLEGRSCVAQVWRAQVGRVPLYLLDCDVEDNAPEERTVTDRLYAGGSEHRLRQEIVLGIGGVRALRALGHDADVFHSNEGHAGFLGLERIRELVATGTLDFGQAVEAVRVSTIFTTHTPVPAGIDRYDLDLMRRYFESYAKESGASFEELIDLGLEPANAGPSPAFNMAVMGLRLAGRSNGVSKLHGKVSRSMFVGLWPEVPEDEVPITSITNGVHTSTWLGPELAEIFNRRLSPGWAETGGARWDRIKEVPDAELWRARDRARERLVYFVRERLRKQLLARGASESEVNWTDEVFDPGVLTIGFARRFAQYKRGTLLLAEVDRIKALLLSSDKPIQLVLAGKAHPRDDGGKEMIRQLVHFARDPEIRFRFAFIEDYDMEVGRYLTQGADVWLNNPRRPLEACGTSGMKAALNGALNCSILDGWWDECYNGDNGWAIGTDDVASDLDYQDRVDASALYDLLEREITVRFYDRSEGPVPRRWTQRVKASIQSTGRFVTADRMVRDYVTELYEPAAAQGATLRAGDYERARALADWKARIRAAWDGVRVLDVDGDITAADVGDERTVGATVKLGELETSDIMVQLAHGRVGPTGELVDPTVVAMKPAGTDNGICSFRGTFGSESAGLYGFAVRVIPAHEDLPNSMDVGLITWA